MYVDTILQCFSHVAIGDSSAAVVLEEDRETPMSVKTKTRAYRYHEVTPSFPKDFKVQNKEVLQFTDPLTKQDKFYCIEVHVGTEHGKDHFRVFSHYGVCLLYLYVNSNVAEHIKLGI